MLTVRLERNLLRIVTTQKRALGVLKEQLAGPAAQLEALKGAQGLQRSELQEADQAQAVQAEPGRAELAPEIVLP